MCGLLIIIISGYATLQRQISLMLSFIPWKTSQGHSIEEIISAVYQQERTKKTAPKIVLSRKETVSAKLTLARTMVIHLRIACTPVGMAIVLPERTPIPAQRIVQMFVAMVSVIPMQVRIVTLVRRIVVLAG